MAAKGKLEEFKFECLQDADGLADYFEAIADGLRKGGLTLTCNGREMALEPRGLPRFRLTARRGKHRSRISMKFTWREDYPGREDAPESLRITPKSRGTE